MLRLSYSSRALLTKLAIHSLASIMRAVNGACGLCTVGGMAWV